MTDSTQGPFLDRRRLLGCAALFGVSGPLLVACGSDGDDSSSPSSSESGSAGSSGSGNASPKSEGGLVAAADVPVGGGVILTDQALVVTQPTKGEFKAFSSICTHQGNPLSSVGDGNITCKYHGSQFSIEDGSNVTGPNGAPGGSVSPLQETAVTVTGGQVVKA